MNRIGRLRAAWGWAVVVGAVALLSTGCPGSRSGVKVSFTAEPTTGDAPLAVTFHGKVNGLSKFRDVPVEPPVTPPVTVKAWNWTFGDGATGTGQNPTHTYTQPGRYDVTLTLLLSDNSTPSDSKSNFITATQPNRAPVANAGPDQNVARGAVVQLDGSGSSDADNDPLAYAWTLVSRPAESAAALSNAAAQNPSFTADLAGEYVLRLVVNDGKVDSVQDAVRIQAAAPQNRPPVANAGADLEVQAGAAVHLNGSGSTDPDGDLLTFQWVLVTRPQGSAAALDNAASVQPGFTADVAGEYRAQLVVNDGQVSSVPDEVVIQAGEIPNRAPVADAGADRTVTMGDAVQVDGSNSSDPDNDTLTYQWSFVLRPQDSVAALDDATAVTPTFTADKAGDYQLQLIVNDGETDSAADVVTIHASEIPNRAPVADAGTDREVLAGAAVELDGSSSSDPDNDALTYQWSFVSRPQDSVAALDDAAAVKPTFTADKTGEFRLQLIVNDGEQNSEPDEVVITAGEQPNNAPTANAGPDLDVLTMQAVELDGSNSTDPDGDALTYLWSFEVRPEGSAAALDNATAVKPTFTADTAGEYRLRLIVNDGKADSEPDTVTVVAGEVQNTAPVANAGPDQEVAIGAAVSLDGSGSSDAENQPLTYAWQFLSRPAGSAALLSNPAAVAPTFTADLEGEYVVQLVANDGHANSEPDTVVITASRAVNAAPRAFAGLDRSAYFGATVELDGGGSTDPEGAPLSYRWALINVPGGSAAVLSSETAVNPTFPADFPGLYVAQLIVNDGQIDSEPDTVAVEVLSQGVPQVLLKQEAYTVQQGQTLAFDVGGVDPDGDPVTLSAAPAMANATFEAENGVNATGAFSFQPGETQVGLQVVSFTAQDSFGLSDTRHVTIEITHLNRPPALEVPAEVSVNEGTLLAIPVVWSDPDGDLVTATASPLPENSVFVPSTGTISFAPDYTQQGEYTIDCEASDGQATSGVKPIHVTVVDVPGEGPDAPREVNLILNPVETPTLLKSVHIAGMVNAGENPPPPATLTSALIAGLNPSQARRGETVDVRMSTGASKKYETHFAAGVSAPDFGDGITVVSTSVLSANELVATVKLDVDAALGPRAVQVTTGAETALSMLAFNVLQGVTRVTGTLTEPDTGAPIAGATVTVQGTNITTTTDASGAFTLNDVPTGDIVIFVNPRDHRLIRIATSTSSGERVDLGAIESQRTVFDANTAPSVSLFSVLARGFGDATGGMKTGDAEKVVRDAMLLTGGDEGGVIDDYGNQLNSAVQGAGLVSLTPSGIALLAQRLQRGGESVALADALYAISYGFEWSSGAPPTLAEWLDTLQQLVNQAWLDPTAPENQLVVLMFNKGENLLFDAPILGPDTRLSPLQSYLFMSSLWAEFGARIQEKAKPKIDGQATPVKAGNRSYTSFWRNAGTSRNAFINGPNGSNGLVARAAVNYLLYMNSLMLPMPGVLGLSMNLAARAPMAGVVFDEMTGAFGFTAMANSLPEPPTDIKAQMIKGGDGRVTVEFRFLLSRSQKKSEAELPAYLYNLYRYSTADGERKLVDHVLLTENSTVWAEVAPGVTTPMDIREVKEEWWRSIRISLHDSDPLPTVTTPSGDVVQAPAATWFYAVTLSEVDSAAALMGDEVQGASAPWWTLPLSGRLVGLTPFVLNSRKVRTSDYSVPVVLTVTSTGETVKVDEIEVDPTNNDIYYSDTKGGFVVGPTGQPAFYRIGSDGTGQRELFAESGFKAPGHSGLAVDSLGNVYTDNAASDASFGGRLFRYAQADGAKTFTGSINYYSLELQYANPVSGGPLSMGPGANADSSREDLYVVEKLSNSVRRAPVQATYDSNRRVAQPWADIPFQSEPLDLEVRDNGRGDLLVHRIAAAALGANVVLSDLFLMPNRDLTVTVHATNPTLSAVSQVMPLAPVFSDPSLVTFVSGPEPASVDLASYGTQDFVFHYRTASSGMSRVYGQVQGQDSQDVTISSPQAPPGGSMFEVGCPLEFVSLVAEPDQLAPGNTITIKGRVVNRGSTAFRDVTPTLEVADTGASYPGTVTKTDGPVPANARLAGSASQEFVWHFQADDLGEVTFAAKVSGVEEESGDPVLSRPYQSNKVLITPITVTLTIEPETILFKDDTVVAAHVSVTNTGTKTLKAVTPTLQKVSGAGVFETIVALDAGPMDLAAGATKVFEFELRKPTNAGAVTLEAAVNAKTADDKAIPSTTDTKEIVIGPRISLKLYDVLLRINGGDLGFDPAILEKRFPLADVVVRLRPYPWLSHPELETQGTSDAQGNVDLAVPERGVYEVRAEVPLGIEGPNKEPLKIGFTDKVYALTDDVTTATIQVPKSMLARTFELLNDIKEIDAALGRFPLWGNEIKVKVGYYELHTECTRVLMETFCKGEDTPLYDGIYSPGGYRHTMSWDAVPRLAVMLAFAKVRLDETSETTCNFVKSVLPAFWASRTGTALLDKTTFKTKREQFEQELNYSTGQKYEMDFKKSDVQREMTLRIQKSVMAFIGFMLPPGKDKDEIVARAQECVDWLCKIYWAAYTFKGLDDIAKSAAQMAVTEFALEGYLQPIYINTTTQPMLMEVVESVQQPSRIRGGTLPVLKAVADYDVVLRAEHASRKSTTETAQNTFGGADDFDGTMSAITEYGKLSAGTNGKVSAMAEVSGGAAPVLKKASLWLMVLDAARTVYVLSIVEPGNVCVTAKKVVDFDLAVDFNPLGGLSALLGKVNRPLDALKQGTAPPAPAAPKEGETDQLPDAAAYISASEAYLPVLQSGDEQAARQGLSAFLDAHLKVTSAMNLAAKRVESAARTQPEEDPLKQPTNSAIQLAGEAQRQRDQVCLMLYSALEMNEGLDGIPKAAELVPTAQAATLAAAEALNPLIARTAGLVVPATFEVKAKAALEAATGETVPITVTLTNVGDETADPVTLRVTRTDGEGTSSYELPVAAMAPFESEVQTLAETMPAEAGNITLLVTAMIDGQPDTSAEVEIRTPEAP